MNPTSGTRRRSIDTAALDRTRRRLARYFMAHHAISPEDAIYFTTTSAADEKVFKRMVRHGLIRDADRRRYYLDLAAYDAHVERRRRLGALIAFSAAATLAVLVTLLFV